MRYPGIIVCIVYTIGSNAGSVDGRAVQVPGRSSDGQVGCLGKQQPARHRTRRSLLEEFIRHVFDSLPKIRKESIVAGVEGIKRDSIQPGLKKLGYNTIAQMNQETIHRASDMEVQLKARDALARAMEQYSDSGSIADVLSHLVEETITIHKKHQHANYIERKILSHIYSPPDIDALETLLKKMTATRRSRRDKLKRLFEFLPEVRPIRVSDKFVKLLKLHIMLFKREKDFLQFVIKNFDSRNLKSLESRINELLSALRSNIERNPVQDLSPE